MHAWGLRVLVVDVQYVKIFVKLEKSLCKQWGAWDEANLGYGAISRHNTKCARKTEMTQPSTYHYSLRAPNSLYTTVQLSMFHLHQSINIVGKSSFGCTSPVHLLQMNTIQQSIRWAMASFTHLGERPFGSICISSIYTLGHLISDFAGPRHFVPQAEVSPNPL